MNRRFGRLAAIRKIIYETDISFGQESRPVGAFRLSLHGSRRGSTHEIAILETGEGEMSNSENPGFDRIASLGDFEVDLDQLEST